MRENKVFFSFAFDSAHVKYGVWTWPNLLKQLNEFIITGILIWLVSVHHSCAALFSVFTSPWSKLKIVTIQWIKSRIWDTIDNWYLNNLTKNQVSAVFLSCVSCRSVSPKFIELCMETPCLRPSEGHKHGGRFWNLPPRPADFFLVVLSLHLQMDTNFCVSSTRCLLVNRQSTNGQHSGLVAFQTQAYNNRTYAAICHATF